MIQINQHSVSSEFDAGYIVPKRADLRTPKPHVVASTHKLVYSNDSGNPLSRSKKLKELQMKMMILREILRFKKAKERFIQKTNSLKSHESPKSKLLGASLNGRLPAAAPRAIIPIIYSFNLSQNSKSSLTSELQPFKSILIELMNHIYSPSYNVPVNAKLLNIPDYTVKIKKPMDLGTIKYRLENGKYSAPSKVIGDIRLVWTNAMTFNPPGNQFHTMAAGLSEMFEKRLKEVGMCDYGVSSGFMKDISFQNMRANGRKHEKKSYDLDNTDYDNDTGEVIELSVYEKDELKQRIASLDNPQLLKTVVEIIKTDSKYQNADVDKKLEFEISALSNVVVRKLYKFINSIPNIGKIAKQKTRTLDADYQLKQIDTKLTNEFSNDRSALIESVKRNGFTKPAAKNEPIKNEYKENESLSNLEKSNYYSKLLEESSSDDSDSEDELVKPPKPYTKKASLPSPPPPTPPAGSAPAPPPAGGKHNSAQLLRRSRAPGENPIRRSRKLPAGALPAGSRPKLQFGVAKFFGRTARPAPFAPAKFAKTGSFALARAGEKSALEKMRSAFAPAPGAHPKGAGAREFPGCKGEALGPKGGAGEKRREREDQRKVNLNSLQSSLSSFRSRFE